jgi:hypothetical protein
MVDVFISTNVISIHSYQKLYVRFTTLCDNCCQRLEVDRWLYMIKLEISLIVIVKESTKISEQEINIYMTSL